MAAAPKTSKPSARLVDGKYPQCPWCKGAGCLACPGEAAKADVPIFTFWAGGNFVASFTEEEMRTVFPEYKEFVCPEEVMAAKAEVRPKAREMADLNPKLIEPYAHLPREHAIEILVGQMAGELLFEKIKSAGMVRPRPEANSTLQPQF